MQINRNCTIRTVASLLTALFMFLPASESWAESLRINDLVIRNDIFYEKFSDVPFTGKLSGKINGEIKNGKRNGLWTVYHDNGQLHSKGKYKNGNEEGLWEWYFDNGGIMNAGYFKYGKRDGLTKIFDAVYGDGTLVETRTYKDGKLIELRKQ